METVKLTTKEKRKLWEAKNTDKLADYKLKKQSLSIEEKKELYIKKKPYYDAWRIKPENKIKIATYMKTYNKNRNDDAKKYKELMKKLEKKN